MKELLILLVISFSLFSQSIARISHIEGKVSVYKKNVDKWIIAKVNMPLKENDEVYTGKESFAEIMYKNGGIVRLDEETKLVIEKLDNGVIKNSAPKGNIWVNMKKLFSSGKKYEISTPTATAAIRGTAFYVGVYKDSLTDVAVYRGKVAVVSSSANKNKKDGIKKSIGIKKPSQIGGPTEIPGPYEVSLTTWRTIVAGQIISVRKDGKFYQRDIDTAKVNNFVQKNMELDKKEQSEK